MSQCPRVSVILTSFNHEKYLNEAIDSVLNQSFEDFELIIWDDASSDNSWEIIQSYHDLRIKTFRNSEQRRGIYGINKAISEITSGEYIAIHHSDDVWELDKLKKQVDFLDARPEIGAVFTNALPIDEDSRLLQDKSHFYFSIFNQENKSRHLWLRHFFEKGNALCHPSVLIRRRCYDDCGQYRYGLAQLGDFDMWIRLCLKYEIHILPDKLIRFRVRDNEANASGNRPETRSRWNFEYYLLLSNFLKIDQTNDLFKVFPEAKKYCSDGSCICYAIAMVMLEIRPFHTTIQFALQILFDLINDQNQNSIFFSVNDFIKLTGELDPLRILNFESFSHAVTERDEKIVKLNQTLTENNHQIANLNQAMIEVRQQEKLITEMRMELQEVRMELQEVLASKSWRITRPLRGVRRIVDRCITSLSKHLATNALRIARYQLRTHGAIGFLRRIPYYLRQLRYRPDLLLRTVPAHAPEFLPGSDMRHEVRMHPELQARIGLHQAVKVSVVIPTLNAGPEFPWLLQKLFDQKDIDNIEIVIVDSGSKDDTVMIAKKAGCVVVKILPVEFSHSYARNRGADEATGDYLLFMVQDAYPIGNYWMVGILQFLQDHVHDKLIAASCAEYSRSDSDVMYDSMIHTHYQFLGCLNYDRIGEFKEQGHISLRSQGQLSDVSCMIERSVFQRYRYRGDYAEDLELGTRLIQDGYRVAMLASIKVIHSHNRPAYYYFKRSFVDVIFLVNLFPDFKYAHIKSQDGLFVGILSTAILLTRWLQTPLPSERTDIHDIFQRFNDECRHQFSPTNINEAVHLDDEHLDDWLEQFCQRQEKAGLTQRKLDVMELQEARRFLDAFLGRVDHFGRFVKQIYGPCTDALSIELRQAIIKIYGAAAGSALAFMFLDITRQRCQGDLKQAQAIYSDLKAGI